MKWSLVVPFGVVALFILFLNMLMGEEARFAPTVVLPQVAVVRSSTTSAPKASTTPQTATTTKKAATKKAPTAKSAATTTKVTASPPPQPTQAEFDATAASLKSALVNILCLSGDSHIHSISGSGVMIDPRGIILTNAHIAQYFLFAGERSHPVSCTIRVGSPARNTYRASLMFVSPRWINANADLFTTPDPTGTGEYDFAFLAITGSLTNTPLPTSFAFVPLDGATPYASEPSVIGGYAAQFLSSSQIQSDLYPTVVFGTIKEVYTFTKTNVDVFTVFGSAASQEGSSGGGVVRVPGTLLGIVTTSTNEGSTGARTLGGITTSYIRREYADETGSSLPSLFGEEPLQAVSEFAPQIAALRALLTAHIQ